MTPYNASEAETRDLIHTVPERYRSGMNPGRAFPLIYHQKSGIGAGASKDSGMMIMNLLQPYLGKMERGLRSSLADLQTRQAADKAKQLRNSFERNLTTLRAQTQKDNERHSRAQRELAHLVTRHVNSGEESIRQLRKLVDERFAELARAELAEERARELLSSDSQPITQKAAKRIIQESIQDSQRKNADETRRRERKNADKVLMRLQSDASYERLRGRA
jgi:hypothetical protein